MLTISNNKNAKRLNENQSYKIIGAIILTAFIFISLFGDLS